MSAASPNTQSRSVRRRVRNAVCTLFCRPTRPPSPPQDMPDLPLGPELGPNPVAEFTPPAGLVEGGPAAKSSAQKHPGELSAEGSSAESINSPEPLEDVAISAHDEGNDTALQPASTPATPTHEGLGAVLPLSNPPTPPPGSTLSVDALAPASDTSADDDSDVQSHTQPSHPVDSSPGDVHDHPFETTQKQPASISSAASSILLPAAPAAPVAPNVEDSDSQLSIAEQESASGNGENETQGQLCLTSVVITLNGASDENTLPLRLAALCLLGVGGFQEGECIPLDQSSLRVWALNECIVLLIGVCGMYCVIKDEEGDDIGFVYLKQEDLQTSGASARSFVPYNSQLSLSMSWKIAHDTTQSPGVGLLQEWGMDAVIGDSLDDPGIDPAAMERLFEGSIHQQENSVIRTLQDYDREGVRLALRFESTGLIDDINGSIAAFECAIETCPEGHAALPGQLNNLGAAFQSRFECTGDMSDSTKAITAQQKAVKLTPEGHADLAGWLNDLGTSFQRRFEHTGDMSDIAEAITANQKAVQLTPEGHADLPGRLNNLGTSLQRCFEHTGNMSDIAEAITANQKAVQFTPEGHVDLPGHLNNLGTSFQRRFERIGDMSDIVKAITVHQKAVKLTPEGDTNLPMLLSNLGASFQRCFECTGDKSYITDAITVQQKAVQLTPEGHPNLAGWLNNLGNSFQICFDHNGDMSDITKAITAQQKAVQLTPEGHPNLPGWFGNLGTAFQSRFYHTGNMSDITEAITVQQKAVELTPESHANLSGRLSNLGNSFRRRFERTGNMSDISEAITANQRAVQLTPEGHANLPGWLGNLGNSFHSRFDRNGDMYDITEAITAQQKAVQLTPEGHPNLSGRLSNLGISFRRRFERTGDMSDIAEAITANQRAVQLTPEGHADLPGQLSNLGNTFQSRFDRNGDMSDITKAITAHQKAVQLTPEGHANLPGQLSNLGNSFQKRFYRTGNMSDITEAITANQKAVQLTPEGHANLSGWLGNLGNSFRRRFERTGDMPDIAEAIAANQKAVQFTPEGHADLPDQLNNLGTSFQCCFEHTGNMSDITKAITTQQKAVKLTPEGHANLPMLLSNLGLSFQSRFERTRDMSDIAEAITANQKAVQLTPEGHADLPGWLSNLGLSFHSRFEYTGDMSDITEAITIQQKVVELAPEGHASLSGWLSNLGNAFQRRFEHAGLDCIGEGAHLEDMHASVKCLRAATENSTGAPTMRLQCAMSWARLINHHNPESCDVLVPFEAAIRLLTVTAGLERTLQGRHGQLQRVSGVALEAAAAACRLGHPYKAVEWLEQGRCLVWGQLNGLRTPMDNLQERDSQLAQRLTDVAKQLEFAGSTRSAMDPSMEMSAKISLEEAARSHLALAREWEELLLAARDIPGFESFLLPSPCSALLKNLPESGPIIIINSHQDRCDALALLHGSDQPLHIPLPNFSLKKANQCRNVLNIELHSNRIRMREEIGSSDKKLEGTQGRDMTQDWPDETTSHGGGDTPVNRVLQSLWLEVAKPILDMLGYSRYNTSSDSVLPKIWWCPTGVMSFVPIHAAGIYSGTNSECLMDYVVSSYTPTVTAITDRVESSRPIDMTVSGLFLTSQPKAPGAREIPGTTKEVSEVYAKAMEKWMRALKCEGDDISVEDCRRYMGEFSCVHLACHASQNASDPLQSRFLLHKGQLSLLSIIQMNLKNANLAFLSACQTSTGEEKLSDEAVHLAAGMLAAGYRRVVATMWAISDGQAPRVATDFYDYLWNNQVDVTGDHDFDGSLSAHALHHAVQQLRRRLGNSEMDLLTWVPYVHFGY